MLISKPNEWYFLLLRFNVSNYDSVESKTSVIFPQKYHSSEIFKFAESQNVSIRKGLLALDLVSFRRRLVKPTQSPSSIRIFTTIAHLPTRE